MTSIANAVTRAFLVLFAFVSLLAAQSTQWTGSFSNDWASASNWTNGVPDATRTAIVVAVATRRVPLITGTGTCFDLQVQSGGLRIDGTLGVHGSIAAGADLSGTGLIRMVGVTATGSIVAAGNQTLPSLDIRDGRDILLDGPEILGFLRCGNGRVRWQGRVFVHGSVALTCQHVSAVAATDLTVLGNLDLATTSTVTSLFTSLTLGGHWTSTNRLQLTTGSITFTRNGTHTFDAPGSQIGSMTIGSTETVTLPNGLLAVGAVTVQGTLQSTSTATRPVDIGGNATVAGAWQSSGPGTRVRGNVTLSGSLSQAAGSGFRVDGDLLVQSTGAADGILELHGSATLGASVTADLAFWLDTGSYALTGGPGITARSLSVAGINQNQGALLEVRDIAFSSDRTLPNFRDCSVRIAGTQVVLPSVHLSGAGISGEATSTLVTGDLVMLPGSSSGLDDGPGTVRILGDLRLGDTNTFQSTTGVIIFGAGAGSPTQHLVTSYALSATINTLRVERGAVVTFDSLAPVPNLIALKVYGDMTFSGPDYYVDQVEVFVGGHLTIDDTDISQVYVEGRLDAPILERTVDFIVTDAGIANIGPIGHPFEHTLTATGNFEVRGTGALNLPAWVSTSGTRSKVKLLGTSPNNTSYNVLGTLPELEITGGEYFAGSPTHGPLTVLHDLFTSGTSVLRVRQANIRNDATIGGSLLVGDGTGSTLDVDRHLTIQTTLLSDAPPDTMQCGGNWVSNANFQGRTTSPFSDLWMDGTGSVTMTAAGTLPGLHIAAGCNATLDRLLVRGDLQVDGTLTVSGTAATIWGSARATGVLTVPTNGTVTFGSTTAPGGGTIDLPTTSRLPTTTFADDPWTITNLTVSQGLTMATACDSLHVQNLDVVGATSLRGSQLTGTTTGTLRSGGTLDLLLQTTVTTPPGTITAVGNLQLGATFQPTSGRVVLASTVTRQITGTGSLANLTVQTGTWQPANPVRVRGTSLVIQPGATLDLAARRLELAAGATANVAGRLYLTAGGSLELGTAAQWTQTSTSVMRLLGTWTDPVLVQGTNYGMALGGRLEAMNFVFSGMDARGIRLLSSATFGTAPQDFRGGRFTGGSPQVGSILLDVQRTPLSTTTFHELDFDSAGGATYGVASTGAGRAEFVNAEGDRAGQAHELDPNQVVDWRLDRTELTGLTARGSFLQIAVAATTARENAIEFRLSRAPLPTGTFVAVQSWTPAGTPGASYTFPDPLAAGTEMHYRFEERLLHGEWRLLASDYARVFPANGIGGTLFVGPGALPSIDAAIAAAPDGGKIVVAAGTWPAFTLTRAISIYAAGDGPVIIEADQPVVVQGLAANAIPVQLEGLQIVRGPQHPGGGALLQVTNNANILILNELELLGDATVDAMHLTGCPQVKLQDIVANRPLRCTNSTAYADHSTLGALILTAGARVTTAATSTTSTQADASSLLAVLPGTSPHLALDTLWRGGDREVVTVHADPAHLWLIVMSTDVAYRVLTPAVPLDMVALLQGTSTLVLGVGAPPTGVPVPYTAPDLPSTYGTRIGLQVVGFDPVTGTGRFGTFRRLLFLP